jgi:hypothetical protein
VEVSGEVKAQRPLFPSRLIGLQNMSGSFGEKKNSLALSEFEPSDLPARSQHTNYVVPYPSVSTLRKS